LNDAAYEYFRQDQETLIRFITAAFVLWICSYTHADTLGEWIEPDGVGVGDYATDRLGTAWDMSDTAGIELHQIDQVSIQNGILKGTTGGNDPWIAFELDPLDLPDTRRYGTVGFRFLRSPGGPVGIYWKDESNQWRHTSLMCPDNEWITAVTELWQLPEWTGHCTALRIDPATSSGVEIRLDQVTLTEGDVASDSFTFEMDVSEPMVISLQYREFQTSSWTPLPSAQQIEAGNGNISFSCDVSSLQGGRYYEFRSICECSARTDTVDCPGFLRADRTPSLTMTDPAEDIVILEAPDFATLRGDPWDMNGISDIGSCGGMVDIQCQNGLFSARTVNNDPWVVFSGNDIDASQYTVIGWYMKVSRSGRYAFHWMDDQGIWHHSGLLSTARANTWQFYTYDLSCEPSWSGIISKIRIDPVTCGDVWVEFDWVRLVDPTDTGIQAAWNVWDEEGMSTLDLFCRESESGSGALFRVTSLQADNGPGAVNLDISALPPGTYSVVSVLDDGAHPLMEDGAEGSLMIQNRYNLPPTVTILSPGAETPRIPDVSEFSRDVLEDPWDFNELSDGCLFHNLTDLIVDDGILTATSETADPYFWLLFQGYYSAQNAGKTGQRFPIDPSTYSLLSFRMYIDEPSCMRLFWYRGSNGAPAECDTLNQTISESIQLFQGWNTYRIDLRTLGVDQTTGTGLWSNHDIINGLRVDPASHAGRTIRIDWFRLSGQGNEDTYIDISWQVEDDLQEAEVGLFIDDDGSGFDGTRIYGPSPATQDIEYITFCTAHLPYPGYHVYAEVSDGVNEPVRSYAPAPMKINAPPLILVREPNEIGSTAFTATPQGDTWDMDSWQDIDMLVNIDNPQLEGGMLSGVSTNSNPVDPLADSQVHLAFTEPINTRRFSAVRFRQWSDQWSVLRLIWRHTNDSQYQATEDFVVYPGWNEFVIPDINNLIMEYPSAQDWSGYITDIFRIDPSELRNSTFQLDYVELYTKDMTEDSFDLKAEIVDPDDDVSLEWYWHSTPESPDSHLICMNNDCGEGLLTTTWDLSNLPGGEYHVYCIADDGMNRTKHHAKGILVLNRTPAFQFIEPDGNHDTVEPGNDYSTEERGDAWDMNAPTDIDVHIGFDDVQWPNGSFAAVTSCNDAYWLWNCMNHPIDTDRYSTVSFQIFVDHPQNSPTKAMIYWKHTTDGPWYHSNFLSLQEGWNTAIVSLEEDYPETWTNAVSILRIDPVAAADVAIELDWVRLSEPGSAEYTIQWTASDPDDDASVLLSCTSPSVGDEDILIADAISEDAGITSFSWDLSPFPPDEYSITATIDDFINAPHIVHSLHPVVISSSQEALNLTGYVVDIDTLRLSWNEPADGYEVFRVYRDSTAYFEPAIECLIAETGGTVVYADITDATMNPDLEYYYLVTFLNSQQIESPPSNIIGIANYSY